MTPDELRKLLAKSVAPGYIVIGTDYLVRRSVAMIREVALGGAPSDFNVDSFRAGQDDLAALRRIVRTLPMMGRRRVVLISEIEKADADDLTVLAEVVGEDIDTACVIASGRSIDKRVAFAKRVASKKALIEYDKLKEQQIAAWAARMAEERGKRLSSAGAAYCTQAFGQDLARMDQEIEKAALYAGEKKAIEADDLQAVMVSVKQEKIFDLMDAVGKRDRAAALFHLDGMLGAGTHPIPLHAQIANHVKKLLRAKSLAAEGKSRDQVAAEMGGHPFATGKVIDQAKNYGLGELRGSLGLLSHTDFDLKNSRANDRAVLEKLILDLCASSGRV